LINSTLNNQKTGSDHNPIIYYRLSYLYKLRGDLQTSMNYINLASKKYYEKMNKKIFKKIEKFKLKLFELENTKNDQLKFIERNQLNLLQIFNLINKINVQPKLTIHNGFQFFKQTSTINPTHNLFNCLVYHLIEEDDIEIYLNNNNNILTQIYNELIEHICNYQMSDSKDLIEIFNKKFHTKFKCLFFEENKIYENFNYKNTEIPIIILKMNKQIIIQL